MTHLLPNGQEFTVWSDTTVYKRTIWVDKANKNASDNNDGSKDAPFLTINSAINAAEAGDRIVIKGGVYRECIKPVRGGEGPSRMLLIEGAEGEEVVISCTNELNTLHEPSRGWKKSPWLLETPYADSSDFADKEAKVWMFSFPENSFADQNPFELTNTSHYIWYKFSEDEICYTFHGRTNNQKMVFTMRRGMLFANGKRLQQVHDYWTLGSTKNAFWVEDDGLTIHYRLDDKDFDEDCHFEYSARLNALRPKVRGLSYIHMKDLHFYGAGNGFPPPQSGMVSTNCGHHWLIENCSFDQANGIGLDIGQGAPMCFDTLETGGHIVRNCTFSNYGIAGLSGVPGGNPDTTYLDVQQEGLFIYNNRFNDNCWQDADGITEEAAIKLHHMKNSIILNNKIVNTCHGCGIWTDASNENLAIRGNVILHTISFTGAIFVEASRNDILVEYNTVIDSMMETENRGGTGIFTLSCENVTISNNIILGCQKFAIENVMGEKNRVYHSTGVTGFNFAINGNIIADCKWAVLIPTLRNTADNNIYGSFVTGGYMKITEPEIHVDFKNWRRYFDRDLNGMQTDVIYENTSDHSLCIKAGQKSFNLVYDNDIVEQIKKVLSSIKPSN